MSKPTRTTATLTALVAELGAYPAHSADAQALVCWATERLQSLLALPEPAARPGVADPGARHCARCRRDIATELGRQHFMN
jgi:hypothetical protein